MDITQEMQTRIIQLEAELAKKQHELEAVHADNTARFAVIESKLAAVCQNEHGSSTVQLNANQKTLVNKPEIFKGEPGQSLDSFVGHMDLYVADVPEETKFNVAVSFLGGHAYDWFKVSQHVDKIESLDGLKQMPHQRFQPINKVKSARDKLAIWKQTKDVSLYNETFLKIIIDIPNISTDEVIDRYMRGLKAEISQELCTTTYDSLTTLMSHALSVEAAKKSFLRSRTTYSRPINPTNYNHPVSMDISNTRMRNPHQRKTFEDRLRDPQWKKDWENGACFSCHLQGCRWKVCPRRAKVNNSNLENFSNQGNDLSQ